MKEAMAEGEKSSMRLRATLLMEARKTFWQEKMLNQEHLT